MGQSARAHRRGDIHLPPISNASRLACGFPRFSGTKEFRCIRGHDSKGPFLGRKIFQRRLANAFFPLARLVIARVAATIANHLYTGWPLGHRHGERYSGMAVVVVANEIRTVGSNVIQKFDYRCERSRQRILSRHLGLGGVQRERVTSWLRKNAKKEWNFMFRRAREEDDTWIQGGT